MSQPELPQPSHEYSHEFPEFTVTDLRTSIDDQCARLAELQQSARMPSSHVSYNLHYTEALTRDRVDIRLYENKPTSFLGRLIAEVTSRKPAIFIRFTTQRLKLSSIIHEQYVISDHDAVTMNLHQQGISVTGRKGAWTPVVETECDSFDMRELARRIEIGVCAAERAAGRNSRET